jgi:hypothetical protein
MVMVLRMQMMIVNCFVSDIDGDKHNELVMLLR